MKRLQDKPTLQRGARQRCRARICGPVDEACHDSSCGRSWGQPWHLGQGQNTPSRMLKKSASGVLVSLRGSTLKRAFRRSETLEGLIRSPRSILGANGPHEMRYVPPPLFAHCGLAWDKARPRLKRLSWQTQGRRVK